MVGSKEEENCGRFEPKKFEALDVKRYWNQDTTLEIVGKETLKPRYYIGDYKEWGIDNK